MMPRHNEPQPIMGYVGKLEGKIRELQAERKREWKEIALPAFLVGVGVGILGVMVGYGVYLML